MGTVAHSEQAVAHESGHVGECTGANVAAVKTISDAPFLNIFSEEFLADPASHVETLRSQSWVVQTPIGGMVIHRDKVQALLADPRLRSSLLDLLRLQGVDDGVLFERASHSLLGIEGDDHTRLRKLVSRAFTPRAVDVHRAAMRDVLRPLLARVAETGRCEFMADVADHYPISVMCDVLGVPAEDHEDFAKWNRAITWMLSFELSSHRDEVEWGMDHMSEYIVALVSARRASPRPDMVTALVQAEESGDRLSDVELLTMIASLLFAGYDTTRNQLGLAMWLFAEHPEQWNLLRANPDLAPKAVEETMRFRGAVGVAPRMVAEDFELDGYRFSAGTMLTLSTGSANHDPAAFIDPMVFDITADREPQLTFGGGPHYCLGANLARAEMQEALPMLAEAMPDLALDGEPTWRPPFGIFGPETLQLRFGPG
jgi:cytochrome P450